MVVVSLSVVGMHQLSVGHEVTTGPTGPYAHAEAPPHSHSDVSGQDRAAPLVERVDLAAGATTAAGSGGLAGDACPTCEDHQLAFGSCLLALTLLVLSWLLVPPRLRHLPPFLRPRLAAAMVAPMLGRLVPPLSLTELSLRRT